MTSTPRFLALASLALCLACGDDDGDGGLSLDGGSLDAGPLTEERCVALGQAWCDEECVELSLDDDHCGSCGSHCAADAPCREGECGGPCPPGTSVACGAACCAWRCDSTGLGCAEVAAECPESPPADGERCVDLGHSYVGHRCDYLRCEGEGFVEARCDAESELWSVTTTTCADIECGGATCSGDGLCVERVGGALLTECAANPCGEGPLYSNCLCSVCPDGAGCSIAGRTVTCNTCTDGPCP